MNALHIFFSKPQKPHFWILLLIFKPSCLVRTSFQKSHFVSFRTLWLTSCTKSEKNGEPILGSCVVNTRADEQPQIHKTIPLVRLPKKHTTCDKYNAVVTIKRTSTFTLTLSRFSKCNHQIKNVFWSSKLQRFFLANITYVQKTLLQFSYITTPKLNYRTGKLHESIKAQN